jgi:hypothetical protein
MADLPVNDEDLLPPSDIDFDDMFVDPNNPRIAPETPPGYDDPKKLFDAEVRAAVIDNVYSVYDAGTLEAQIIAQGWVPVDPILVWKHPKDKRYVVIEGNTRTSVLTRVRERLPKERERLQRLEKARGGGPETPDLRRQKALVAKIEALIASTKKIKVLKIRASTVKELKAVLPRLHGVRHIQQAKPWGPHAVGLYILSLYQERFAATYPGEDLRIDDDVIADIAAMLPKKPDEIRKNIQAVSAFEHFKFEYEDRAAEVGNTIEPTDQYFFSQILDNKVARDAFKFESTDLTLSESGEEALFQWAFSKKRDRRKSDDEDSNVFQKAEDMRIWQRIYNYDKKTGVTQFHKQLDIESPIDADPIRVIEARKNLHREVNTPLRTLEDLLDALKGLKGETIIEQAEHLRPLLQQAGKRVKKYLKMIEAAEEMDDDEGDGEE